MQIVGVRDKDVEDKDRWRRMIRCYDSVSSITEISLQTLTFRQPSLPHLEEAALSL